MRIGVTYDLKDEYRELGFTEAEIAEFDSPETIDGLCGALSSLGGGNSGSWTQLADKISTAM